MANSFSAGWLGYLKGWIVLCGGSPGRAVSGVGGPGVSGDFFQMLYQVLIGQERGPRFGSFAALYGIDNTRRLIADALDGKMLK